MILKHKATRRLRFRAGRTAAREQGSKPMTPEKRITFLGVIEKGEADEVFFVPDLNAPPEEIAQAIKRANAQREAEKRRK